MELKKRRVTKKDHNIISEKIREELSSRKRSSFRKQHETIWSQIDKQIAMEAPVTKNKSGKKEDWHSAIQLGDLADASEILTEDVMMKAMRDDRKWFQPHTELPFGFNPETGTPEPQEPQEQKRQDNVLRSLMVQQHMDFGFKDRVKLSVKEALHHGSMVAEVRWETMPKYEGAKVSSLEAPVWVPYSMWNCYPDPSSSVIGTDLFYRGSMIIVSFMKLSKVKSMKGWINKNQIKETGRDKRNKTKDVEIVTWYGDISIERKDGDIFVPNMKVIIANDTLVFAEPIETPYLNIIYLGYEKDDVRDPYFTSPLIKRSPMHKLATFFANKAVEAIQLRTEPPYIYDAFDSKFAKEGAPDLSPGVKIGARGTASVKTIQTADPTWAIQGMQMAQQHVERGTSVDATRAGVSSGGDVTATEIVKKEQKGEIRTLGFVGTLERRGLRPFLFMQHDLNRKKLNNYPFLNDDITTPDFLRGSKDDLEDSVMFEITGSRALLGEEQRTARFNNANVAILGSPELSQMVDKEEILKQTYEDTGVKDPERFILKDKSNPEIEDLQNKIQELQDQLNEGDMLQKEQGIKDAGHELEKEELRRDLNTQKELAKLVKAGIQLDEKIEQTKTTQ